MLRVWSKEDKKMKLLTIKCQICGEPAHSSYYPWCEKHMNQGMGYEDVSTAKEKAVKQFSQFRHGLAELMKLSFSVEQALTADGKDPRESDNPEAVAVATLATNVAFDRPTGNGVGWDECEISIRAGEIDYVTTGGLRFGWAVHSSDYQNCREREKDVLSIPAKGTNCWTFYIQHPLGGFPKGSTLFKSCQLHGWHIE